MARQQSQVSSVQSTPSRSGTAMTWPLFRRAFAQLGVRDSNAVGPVDRLRLRGTAKRISRSQRNDGFLSNSGSSRADPCGRALRSIDASKARVRYVRLTSTPDIVSGPRHRPISVLYDIPNSGPIVGFGVADVRQSNTVSAQKCGLRFQAQCLRAIVIAEFNRGNTSVATPGSRTRSRTARTA